MDWREDLILNFVDKYSENREERKEQNAGVDRGEIFALCRSENIGN